MEGDNTVLRESTSSGVQNVDTVSNINSEIEPNRQSDENNAALNVLKFLQKDLMAADLKWSLFIAACQSYRFDSCLRPFPPMFFHNDIKDINAVNETVYHIPAFSLLERFIQQPDNFQIHDSSINLLHWNLIQLKEPTLESVPNSEIDSVINLVPSELFAQRPDFLFKVQYGQTSAAEAKWKAVKEGYNTLFAYHGSRLENFHSILNYGLQQHLNKNALFGQGIYLSSELLVSLPYSQNGCGWGKSVLGPELSIVALCEMIDHPTINCQSKGEGDKSRATAKDSYSGEVPHKFYLVPNSDLVRVRYLLVYSRAPPFPYNEMHPKTVVGWLKEHKLATVILGYVVMLASVGLSNNQYVQRCYKMLCQKIGLYF